MGDRMLRRQVVSDQNMLNDIVVIMEKPYAGYLDDGAVPVDDTPIGITVFRDELYSHSRVVPERRTDIKDRFGVIPLDSNSILFQGVMFDGDKGPVFHPVNRDFVTHEPITDEGLLRRQHLNAEKYLTIKHPADGRTTPMGMLLSLGTKPRR